jgi:hypothetical protein
MLCAPATAARLLAARPDPDPSAATRCRPSSIS